MKDLNKKAVEVNSRLKNFCTQKKIDFIDNTNIKEEHLGNKKLHLNKRGNTVLANNLLKYLRSALWDVDFLNCYLESNNSKSNSKSLDISYFISPFFQQSEMYTKKELTLNNCGSLEYQLSKK